MDMMDIAEKILFTSIAVFVVLIIVFIIVAFSISAFHGGLNGCS